MRREYKLDEKGQGRRNELLRQLGINPEQITKATLVFEANGLVTMTTTSSIMGPGALGPEFLAAVTEGSERAK